MQYMPFSLEIFICLKSLELSAPVLPDQDLACAIKTVIEEELHRSMAFQRADRNLRRQLAVLAQLAQLGFCAS